MTYLNQFSFRFQQKYNYRDRNILTLWGELLAYILLFFSCRKQLLNFLINFSFVLLPDNLPTILTPDQIVELLNQGIQHYTINLEFTNIMLEFKKNYPKTFLHTYEDNLNYIDYFRCINSKLHLLLDIHNSKINHFVTSNFIPTETSYDFFTSNNQNSINRYQLKNRLSLLLYNIQDLNDFIETYQIRLNQNNFLTLDLSTLPESVIEKHQRFINTKFEYLVSNKKIIIHTKNIINTNQLHILENSKYLIKMKF